MSHYVANAQNRHEKMKFKIAEVVHQSEKSKADERVKLESKLKQELSEKIKTQKKASEIEVENAASNSIYERPQAQALADSFLNLTKEIFAMSDCYENFQDSASKSFRMKLKLTINRKTGQITDSLKQIRTIVHDLVQLCFESRTISKQAFSYCLVLLSNKFIV